MTYNLWLKIGIKLFAIILPAVTPAIRDALVDALKGLYDKAKSTDNILDDMLIKFFLDLLQYDINNDINK